MIVTPDDLTAAPASAEYLANVRTAAPALAPLDDDTLLYLGARIASLAYAGARAEVWDLGRDLRISEDVFDVLVREALTTLYPVALVAEPAASPTLPV